ncbi:polyphosphate kinase 2 [Methylocapsa aurea]|uniref:polyphosphate kinase 2 n=1 Tax=Methylocapsa aurea TaxID=663610 RepID=UPI000A072AB8|nr:polyphosphate kinase 2 [Methylocapsa aurea]
MSSKDDKTGKADANALENASGGHPLAAGPDRRGIPSSLKFPIDAPQSAKTKRAALRSGDFPYDVKLEKDAYKPQLRQLQIELVKMLDWVKREGERIVIIFEGRDAAGKGGTIQRLTEHLNPRSVRVVALPRPTERETGQWYFQRYAEHLPPRGEIAIFDRSWYNRAAVEPVFGFCTPRETTAFLYEAPIFEAMLARDGIRIIKFFLSIGREMQIKRLLSRWRDPVRRWKLTDIDLASVDKWDAYSAAFERMLATTDSAAAPWTVIHANDKLRLRLETIRHVLDVTPYGPKDAEAIGRLDAKIIVSAATFLGTGGEEE